MLRTTSPQDVRTGLGKHGARCGREGRSIGRSRAFGQFTVAMGDIHFMNVCFTNVLIGFFLLVPWPVAAVEQIGCVAGATGTIRRWQVTVIIAGLRLVARGQLPRSGRCRAVRLQVPAACARAPAQQGQSTQQAKTFNHAIAISGAAVAPGQHAEGACISFQWRQIALVGANGQQGGVGKNDGAPMHIKQADLKQQAYVHSCFWANI